MRCDIFLNYSEFSNRRQSTVNILATGAEYKNYCEVFLLLPGAGECFAIQRYVAL